MTTIHGFAVGGHQRTWPPECARCGFKGEPTDRQSPYVACGGDPAKHIRPVTERKT